MYFIMYKDIPVMEFDLKNNQYKYLEINLLPIIIANIEPSWQAVQIFCNARCMSNNRKYRLKILKKCNIEDYTDINICIEGKGLSLKDNYWIKKENSSDTWSLVNLYHNNFSNDISYTALTGEYNPNQNKYLTGELTVRGNKAKCFYKNKDGIFLFKEETEEEIFAEIISSIIAQQMNLNAALYLKSNIYGKNCSVCKIKTSENIELIHARDFLKYFNCKMNKNSMYYKFFYNLDKVNFIKMQLFDYITLNTDRNKDNFGVKRVKGNLVGLYPIYDHDACFKGNLNSKYLVTDESFNQLLSHLKTLDSTVYRNIVKFNITKLYKYFKKEGKKDFKRYNLEKEYNDFMNRIENILK